MNQALASCTASASKDGDTRLQHLSFSDLIKNGVEIYAFTIGWRVTSGLRSGVTGSYVFSTYHFQELLI